MELIVKITATTTRKRESKETTGTSEKEVRYIIPEGFPESESAKTMRMEFTSMICSLFGSYEEYELGLD